MLMFVIAAAAPLTGGRSIARGSAVLWQIAGALGILVCVWVTLQARRYTALVLIASTLLLFASCTANFHWLGG
jgi:hypothetical protein